MVYNLLITLRVGVSSNFARPALVISAKNTRKNTSFYLAWYMETFLCNAWAMIDYWTTLVKTWSKFLLHGDLWAGKTTLTKGIVLWLGLDPNQVQSPTYTYIHVYGEKLLHIDMRRIESEQQLCTLWLLDLMNQYAYIVIEWPKREENYADSSWQHISLSQTNEWRTLIQKNW